MTDDLQSLWQSEAPKVDRATVISGIEANRRLQERLLFANHAIMAFSIVVVAPLDLQGAFGPPGVLTAVLLVAIAAKLAQDRRKRRACPKAGSLSVRDLLAHAIRHVRTSLNGARLLYGVYPASLLSGYVIGRFLAPDNGKEIHGTELVVWIAGPLAALSMVAAIVAGVRIARTKVRELRELRARLQELREDV